MTNQDLHIVSGQFVLDQEGASTSGFSWVAGTGGNDDIDIDNDGVMVPEAIGVIDLSAALSYRLGRQIPMTANFRVNYIRLSLRNVDDGVDNAQGAFFQGAFAYYEPQKHRIDAIQAWRKLEKELQKEATSAEGLFVPDEKYYKGFRYGWYADTNVRYPTQGAPAALPNGYAMLDMLSHYEGSITDTNGNGPEYDNALWDRRVGRATRLNWSADILNTADVDFAVENIYSPRVNDFVWTAPAGHNIVVMGGLMELQVTHCSTNAPGTVDDDYYVYVDIGISGWQPW